MATVTESRLSPRTRWTIVGLLSASIMINLIDRQTLSQLATILREQWNWSNTQYGYVATIFNLGMMLGQIPAGQFLDRVGTRIGLATIFIGWSIICAAHALAGPGTAIESAASAIWSIIPAVPEISAGLAGFFLLRFVMGLLECGNYSGGIKAVAGLFPKETRSRAGGLFNAGAQLGSVVAGPLILSLLIETLGVGWQMGFVIPAVLGLLWLIPWLAIFPDKATMTAVALTPEQTPRPGPGQAPRQGSGQAPSGAAADVPLSRLILNHHVLGLLLIRVFSGPITIFYWTWLPLYLRNGRGMTLFATGLMSSVPQLFGMAGNIFGGILTDRFVRAMGSDRGRKLGFICALSLSALSMTMPFVSNDVVAVILMGLALFGNQWYAATYIGTVGDIVPQYLVGRVNGIAGFGDSGAVTFAILYTGIVVDKYGWSQVFVAAGVLPLLGLLSLFLVLRKIEPARFEA
jgi:ACS family hexuronate transporter-like MFS transporter